MGYANRPRQHYAVGLDAQPWSICLSAFRCCQSNPNTDRLANSNSNANRKRNSKRNTHCNGDAHSNNNTRETDADTQASANAEASVIEN